MGLNTKQLKSIHKGDKEVFKVLYESYFATLVLYAQTYISNKEEAEDNVQEVFINMLHKKTAFTNNESLKSYLYTSVRNKCLNTIRSNNKHQIIQAAESELLESEEFFYENFVKKETYRELNSLLDTLPPQCCKIFKLSLHGLTSKEIAEDLQLSIETVKTQRKKAKKILKEQSSDLITLITFFYKNFRN